MTHPAFATVREWCELSRMSRRSVYRAMARGDIVARKSGRSTVIEVAPSMAWFMALPKAQVKDDTASVCA